MLIFQQDNAIAYWRKFVAEYYSPRAKKRWCLSLSENVGQHTAGVFQQAAMVSSPIILMCSLCFHALSRTEPETVTKSHAVWSF